MKPFFVKVEMKDVFDSFDTYKEAWEEADRLSRMFPEVQVGIYSLETSFESMH